MLHFNSNLNIYSLFWIQTDDRLRQYLAESIAR